ncbi:MAG: DUF72 domain-containing protein [Herpetosiphonaceae bacterium]|nr:DUF72 domain-containing protein [Herpetosiphonaceae bacterium]
MGMIQVGTSGWSYDHWQDIVYPIGTPSRARLDWYVRRFPTVEVNSSAYHWPRDTTFAGWRERTPAGFAMTLKAPRGLTHSKRLYAPEVWIERMERGLLGLGDHTGVLLVQLPPTFEYDLARLAYFLQQLPAQRKVALELRHPSWNRSEVWSLLERHQAAYCVMSGADLPCILRATAPFVYVRLHGPDEHQLYGGSYTHESLSWWADRIREWDRAGHAVWVYFNNDGGGNAVRNAETLRGLLRV